MRMIDGDALMELLTTAIRNMKGMAKFLGAEDDPEIQMEIKAYTDIAEGVKDMPTIEPEHKTGKWMPVTADLWLGYKCDQCGALVNYMSKYCSWCGAKMIGVKEDEEADIS